jgi:hypothetical protein
VRTLSDDDIKAILETIATKSCEITLDDNTIDKIARRVVERLSSLKSDVPKPPFIQEEFNQLVRAYNQTFCKADKKAIDDYYENHQK